VQINILHSQVNPASLPAVGGRAGCLSVWGITTGVQVAPQCPLRNRGASPCPNGKVRQLGVQVLWFLGRPDAYGASYDLGTRI